MRRARGAGCASRGAARPHSPSPRSREPARSRVLRGGQAAHSFGGPPRAAHSTVGPDGESPQPCRAGATCPSKSDHMRLARGLRAYGTVSMAGGHRGYGPLVVKLRTPLPAWRGRSTARRRGRRGLPHALYTARIAVPPPAPGTAPGYPSTVSSRPPGRRRRPAYVTRGLWGLACIVGPSRGLRAARPYPPLTAMPPAAWALAHGVGPRASMRTTTRSDSRREGSQHGSFLALQYHCCGLQGPCACRPPVGCVVTPAMAW
jgi:hypothetical protein